VRFKSKTFRTEIEETNYLERGDSFGLSQVTISLPVVIAAHSDACPSLLPITSNMVRITQIRRISGVATYNSSYLPKLLLGCAAQYPWNSAIHDSYWFIHTIDTDEI
jgi:hypothetical protein